MSFGDEIDLILLVIAASASMLNVGLLAMVVYGLRKARKTSHECFRAVHEAARNLQPNGPRHA